MYRSRNAPFGRSVRCRHAFDDHAVSLVRRPLDYPSERGEPPPPLCPFLTDRCYYYYYYDDYFYCYCYYHYYYNYGYYYHYQHNHSYYHYYYCNVVIKTK